MAKVHLGPCAAVVERMRYKRKIKHIKPRVVIVDLYFRVAGWLADDFKVW